MMMKKALLTALALVLGLVGTAGQSVLSLDGAWEFRLDGGEWRGVRVPHDWAISGPFDKTNDIQVAAIREDGEVKASEKTGRSGALPWIGSYMPRVPSPKDAEGSMPMEPVI